MRFFDLIKLSNEWYVRIQICANTEHCVATYPALSASKWAYDARQEARGTATRLIEKTFNGSPYFDTTWNGGKRRVTIHSGLVVADFYLSQPEIARDNENPINDKVVWGEPEQICAADVPTWLLESITRFCELVNASMNDVLDNWNTWTINNYS